jgi:hypothetical protein
MPRRRASWSARRAGATFSGTLRGPRVRADVAGVAGTGTRGLPWDDTVFYGALRGDVLFGRSRDSDLGVGPAVELGTAAFSDVRLTLGPTVFLPIGDVLGLAATPALLARRDDGVTSLGASGRLFAGIRAMNHYGEYSMAGGLVLGFDRDLGDSGETAVVIAAHVDGLVLAVPVMLLVSWLRGPPD